MPTNILGSLESMAATYIPPALTMVRHLRSHGGHTGVQHIIDSSIAIQAPLDIMLTVSLVTLLMSAILQAVALQVLEGGAAGLKKE